MIYDVVQTLDVEFYIFRSPNSAIKGNNYLENDKEGYEEEVGSGGL